jgi:hypothetical protein
MKVINKEKKTSLSIKNIYERINRGINKEYTRKELIYCLSKTFIKHIQNILKKKDIELYFDKDIEHKYFDKEYVVNFYITQTTNTFECDLYPSYVNTPYKISKNKKKIYDKRLINPLYSCYNIKSMYKGTVVVEQYYGYEFYDSVIKIVTETLKRFGYKLTDNTKIKDDYCIYNHKISCLKK